MLEPACGAPSSVEQGKTRRAEGPTQVTGDLGDPDTAPIARSKSGELALFNLAIDSKLRSCDLLNLRVRDICHGDRVAARAIALQKKTQRPVQFEITEQTRDSLAAWIRKAALAPADKLFPSRMRDSDHLSTRQYARIVHSWIEGIALDPCHYGTHTMRRTKAALICRKTRNLRVVQLLLGHYEGSDPAGNELSAV